jgi:transaldolase
LDRPNLFIKTPATKAVLPAISASIADGISVNVTLIFSVDRYRAVLDAFITGLEQRVTKGESLFGIESVASFFISRVDTEVDKRLAALGQRGAPQEDAEVQGLHGKTAIANARLAYEVYEKVAASDRWVQSRFHRRSGYRQIEEAQRSLVGLQFPRHETLPRAFH